MPYNPKITKAKAIDGSLDGALAGLIGASVMALVKALTTLDPAVENSLAVAVGSLASAVVVGTKRFVVNMIKHKNDK